MSICSVTSCLDPVNGHSFCQRHLRRYNKHGDPLGGPPFCERRGAKVRFLHEVVLGFTGDKCLQWPFKIGPNGYAPVHYDGRTTYAHRVVCELVHGPGHAGQEVAHSCGVRACCNPSHLRWATRSENHLDKLAHGTMLRGSSHPNTTLSEEEVRTIRGLKGVVTQRSLALRFGISTQSVSRIQRGERWGWMPMDGDLVQATNASLRAYVGGRG